MTKDKNKSMNTTATFYPYARFAELIEKRGEPYVQPRVSTIEEYLGKPLRHGDVVNFDDDRALHSFIVAESDGKKRFMKNPDNAGAGYISIPLAVTKSLKDAVKYYNNVTKNADYLLSDIELSQNDTTVQKIFTSPSDIIDRALFFYYPSLDKIGVEIGGVQKQFSLSVQQSEIERAFVAKKSPVVPPVVEQKKKKHNIIDKVKKALFSKKKSRKNGVKA